MADSNERETEEVLFTPIKPHFFKVILDDAIQNEKLVIPRKFVRKYGQELSNSVVLKIPGGDNWQVDLTKSDGEVSLSKGWQEFAENYHLEHGHFLVFEYENSSCFSITVFDTSATEIDYPCSRVSGANKPNQDGKYPIEEKEETENDATAITLNDCNSCGVKKVRSQLPCERLHKRKRADLASQVESTSKLHKSVSTDDRSRSCKISDRKRRLTFEEKNECLRRAKASFNSKNPFFMVVMQPKYRTSYIHVPFWFAKKHLQENHGQVILQVKGGQSWTVGSIVHLCYKMASFSSSWTAFARHNNLKLSDVVIFELIDDVKRVFNVTISRAIEDVKFRVPQGKSKKKKKKKLSTNLRVTERVLCLSTPRHVEAANPSFTVINRPWNFKKSSMRLPQQFTNNQVERSQTVELQVADRVWPVKLNIHQSCSAALSTGWGAFARDNDLQVGDVCMYELTQKDPMVFSVSIIKYVG